MHLTQKERLYLQDAKKHEELCIAKYNHYSQNVSCQQLKQILQWAGQQEQNHLQTVTQVLQGQMPNVNSGSSGQQSGGMQQGGGQQPMQQSGAGGNQAQSMGSQQATMQQGGAFSQQGGGMNQHSASMQSHSGGQGSGMQQAGGNQQQGNIASETTYTGQGQLSDQQMCNDLLTTEKAISDMYDHAVFESSNQQLRQVLNHIQKEEQDHAFAIYQYMQQKGWYQPE